GRASRAAPRLGQGTAACGAGGRSCARRPRTAGAPAARPETRCRPVRERVRWAGRRGKPPPLSTPLAQKRQAAQPLRPLPRRRQQNESAPVASLLTRGGGRVEVAVVPGGRREQLRAEAKPGAIVVEAVPWVAGDLE